MMVWIKSINSTFIDTLNSRGNGCLLQHIQIWNGVIFEFFACTELNKDVILLELINVPFFLYVLFDQDSAYSWSFAIVPDFNPVDGHIRLNWKRGFWKKKILSLCGDLDVLSMKGHEVEVSGLIANFDQLDILELEWNWEECVHDLCNCFKYIIEW